MLLCSRYVTFPEICSGSWGLENRFLRLVEARELGRSERGCGIHRLCGGREAKKACVVIFNSKQSILIQVYEVRKPSAERKKCSTK